MALCLMLCGATAPAFSAHRSCFPLSADTAAQVHVDSIVAFAQSMLGVPYLYGGCSPDGFDCSGLVHFVFRKVGIILPRSSGQLAQAGTEVPLEEACKGDIIIFAGRDPAKRPVGHAGIIITDPGEPIRFIHSATSRRIGVIESDLDDVGYYIDRFVKLVRIVD